MDTRPIGMFDSGVGGLSVWREVLLQLPHESVIYFADSAHCPYGPKGSEEIIRLSCLIMDRLVAQGCKLVIVACNTITSAAIQTLRDRYPLPIVGMEPAVKPAALASTTRHIGVLATEGTLRGEKYRELQQRFADEVTIHVQIGRGLVELVESGTENSPEARTILWSHLEPMLQAQVDQIVLGCTHYPFLREHIQSLCGNRVTVHDPAPAIARRAREILHERSWEAPPGEPVTHRFQTSGSPEQMRAILSKISREEIIIDQEIRVDGSVELRARRRL